MAESINFTKRTIEGIGSGATREYYHDTQVKGLVLVVQTSGTKSFQVYKKVNGKPVRHTLGKFPDLTVERARKAAYEKLADIADGVNPNLKRQEEARAGITLGEVWADYKKARKGLKANTLDDYERHMNDSFGDWQTLPMREIDDDKVDRRHKKLGERSHARANGAMRVLRAFFNFAAVKYKDGDGRSLFPINPVKSLNAQRAWYKVRRKRTYLKPQEIRPWAHAVLNLTNERFDSQAEAVRDLLLLYLFTGVRLSEGLALRVTDINLPARRFTVPDPKNHQPIELPLTTFTYPLLERRLAALDADQEWVFPSTRGSKSGHLAEPKEHYRAVGAASGCYATPSDLRRTFITLAESMDLSGYTLKRLLNHRIDDADVTAGYIITDVERLRDPAQRVTDKLLELIGPMDELI